MSAIVIVVYLIQVVVLVVLTIRDVRRPVQTLAWVVIALVLPIIGLGLYVVLSSSMGVRRKLSPSENMPDKSTKGQALPTAFQNAFSPTATNLARLVHSMTHVAPVPATFRVFHEGVSTYKALFTAIEGARHRINLEYYIFRDDHTGRALVDLLCRKATTGLRIRFLRDGLGARTFPRHLIRKLESHNVECRSFFPVKFPWLTPKLNHRDHCKIVTIDGNEAFVGGINVGDEYTGAKPSTGPWRDTHLQVYGRRPVQQIQSVFSMNWSIGTPDGSTHRVNVPEPNYGRLHVQTTGEWSEELSVSPIPKGAQTPETLSKSPWFSGYVQSIQSGPDSELESIRNLFFTAITEARRRVTITTPYFVPDTDVLTALKSAVFRGVNVRLLIPHKPDHKVVGLASRTFYMDLVSAGITLHLYENGLLHAKVMTVDDDVAIIGAANYDLRSFRLNFEQCHAIYDSALVHELNVQYEKDLTQAIRVTCEDLQQPSLLRQSVEHVARLFAPLL